MPLAWISETDRVNLTKLREHADEIAAISRTQAVIELTMDGTVITANSLFLEVMGYGLAEIQGKHHRQFVDPAYAQSAEYAGFWARLGRGEFFSGQIVRKAKNGKDVWLQATYNPIFDASGKPYKVVKFAIDVTEQVLREQRISGQIGAIHRSQAVISFNLDGTIITANQNFLDAVGYSLAQIQGKHHSMFVTKEFAESAEHRQFWEKLKRGEYIGGQFKRLNANGQEIWLEATYNPVLDPQGKPVRVVKYAADITKQVQEDAECVGQINAIKKTQAVIHFELDGTIIWANDNFCKTMGYQLSEIKGHHHAMFVDPNERDGQEYRQFWDDLRAGKARSGEFVRFAADGHKVWIQAVYTPIRNRDGKLVKVVKFAYDISEQVRQRIDSQHSLNSALETILSAVATVAQQSYAAVHGSEDTLATVHAVASASEELSASIREISQSMVSSKLAVDEVMTEANSADDSTQRLGEKANEMNKIVELIQEIAEQINLLSLNAAIESARAGDAGRGFAVVASEVKSLANQVQAATGNISNKINSMQAVASEMVNALSMIRSSVQAVQDAVSTTASAVEEQSAVTTEISSNMMTATTSVGHINESLGQVVKAVEGASEVARKGKDEYATLIGA